jgi:hypothetical protein
MWQVCFAVFVAPTALFVAVALLEPLIYGGEQHDARGQSGQRDTPHPFAPELLGAVRVNAGQPTTTRLESGRGADRRRHP